MTLKTKVAAEFFGTFWLVLGGCGAAVLAAGFPELGIGFAGVALAFGLTVLTMVYTVGYISGGHFNPAVSFGLWAAGKFETRELLPYIVAQVLGGILGAWVLYLIATGKAGFEVGAFASNGYGELSPGRYSLGAVFLTEVVMTMMFIFIILGSIDERALAGFAGISIGLGLTLIHLISIPVSNTSVNPARSTAAALFADTAAMSQLWVFWVAPIIGGVLGGIVWKLFFDAKRNAS